MQIHCESPWLVVNFPRLQQCLSWAVCGSGFYQINRIVWHQVSSQELPEDLNPVSFLQERLRSQGLQGSLGMLTSADISCYQQSVRNKKGRMVQCIATVGMTNALRVGDPSFEEMYQPGTINLLCHVSEFLSPAAMVEALSLATEARTAAVLEAQIPSLQTGQPATGTGTDCVVLACPVETQDSDQKNYAGKHTVIGSLIGETVYETVKKGLEIWKNMPA